MFGLGSVTLGITLLILGLAIFLLTYFLSRFIPKIRPANPMRRKGAEDTNIPAHSDSVFMIQPGGRILYVNQSARKQFKLWEEEPNLEKLARRSRPSQIFWGLCTSEGQSVFQIDGRPYIGTSYFVPSDNGNTILLSLRSQQEDPLGQEDSEAVSRTIEILTMLNASMTAELELEPTLETILQSVEQLIPTDFSEITIWDPTDQCLIPFRFIGIQGIDRRLEKTTDRYPMDKGYSGYVAEKKEPVLVPDVDTYHEVRPFIDRKKYPFQSYLGVPLLVKEELIGTLELTSREKNAYTEGDISTMMILAGQAAIAIHNALIYQQEQRRAEELSSLANLAKAVSSIREDKELFAHLVQGITPLLDIEIAGFLLYDETQKILEAQNPFIGVPPQFVELYKAPIPTDSPAEHIWLKQENIVTRVAAEDPRFIDLGLDHSARAAGIRESALIPLKSGGRVIGYLQAANKKDDMPFDQDDIRLLEIIALQAAPIVENAELIKISVGRALRAEALRRIASLSGSTATLDEIFKYSLLELARLLQADIAGIFLLDENLGELKAHIDSLYGIRPEQVASIIRLPVGDENFRHTVTTSKTPFLTGNASIDDRVLPVFSALVEPLKIKSVIDVPLVIRDQGFGEIILCSPREEFFSQSDIQLAATVAGQLAIAYERSTLASQTDVDLRQRVEQLTAMTRIGRELNTSIELPYLLQLIFDEALRTTPADSGTILLFKIKEIKQKMPEISLQLGDTQAGQLTPLQYNILENGSPLIIDDFDNPPEGFDPDIWKPPSDEINSALIVPIAFQQNIAGLINLYAMSPSVFDQASLEITQALAVQATIAIGNAQRFQEQVQKNELLNRRIEILSNLLDATQKINLEQSIETSLEDIAYGIQSSTPFQVVMISKLDAQHENLEHLTSAGVPLNLMEEIRHQSLPWQDVSRIMQPEFAFGRSYFIPHKSEIEMPDRIREISQLFRSGQDIDESTSEWKHQDILIIPLIKPNGEPMGLINVSSPIDEKRPDSLTFETLEIFATQASLIIESQEQLANLDSQVTDLSEKLIQYSEANEQLPNLLQKERDYNDQIQALTKSTERFKSGLNIIEKLNKLPDRLAVLSTLGDEILSELGMDISIVAEASAKGPQLLHVSGLIPDKTNPEALLGQRNPLTESLSTGKTILVPDLNTEPSWKQSPLIVSLNAAGFMCFPVTLGSGVDAAILAVSHNVLPPFTENDKRLFDLLSHQAGIAINNHHILTETGHRLLEVNLLLEFSSQLGSLEQSRILRTLLESALQVSLGAQAGIVTLYDEYSNSLIPQAASGYINNDAMMKIVFGVEETLLGRVFSGGEAVRIDDVNFAHHYPLNSDDLLHYREGTGGILPVSCMVLPLQYGEVTLGVIVLDNFQETGLFTDDDEALITSLAQQTGLTLENARLYQASEKRANQLEALSDVASTITSSLEPDALIDSLLEKLENIIPYETGTLWLREAKNLTIRSARGFENWSDLIGLSTTTEDSRLFSEMVQTNHPISVSDVRTDPRFPGFEVERLSWLGVPLIAKGEMVGLIALEKTEADFYKDEHIQVITTFASQAAVALENATLFQESLQRTTELDQRSQRLALLNRFSNQISSVLEPNYILETTLQELTQALEITTVSAVMWESNQPILMAEFPNQVVDPYQVLPDAPIFERLRQTFGVFNTQDVTQEQELAPLSSFLGARNTKSLLILPLVTGDELHGVFLVQNDKAHRYPAEEIELARIITNQAAVAVQNATSFKATTRLTEELEQRVSERTAQLEQEHLRAQSLLRIMRELSASLDLDQVLNQTLGILNETVGAEFSTILLTNYEEQVFYYRASVGYDHTLPRGGQVSSLKLDEGLAGWVIEHRQSALVGDVHKDERWVPIPDLPSEYRSVIVVPLRVGEETLGVVTLAHSQVGAFSQEDQDLAQAAAMQMAVAINNAELFNLIRDQAEGLGTMLRSQRVEASRSMAILEAVANGVLVTDDNNEITLFNNSAQQILALDRSEVISKSLDAFIGLFGDAAHTWMETIHIWSEDPQSYQIGDTYSERISLENKRIVSVHLAPVVMGNEFLGTVSIFQDITHQVEVDRLKSEFVATVSHELRTPMTSIKGYVDVLLMGAAGELTQQQMSFLDIVKTNTERLNILVNDLLDVSRIEAGKVELFIQPLDMQQIIKDVVNEQERRSEQDNKPMTFQIEFSGAIPKVNGDEERVRQIVDNLVSNAYLYTPEDGQINIRIRTFQNEIQIDVQDNGIGVRPEDHERIFERFYRGEDPLVLISSGNGLGLSIVRQLVAMHHGRIWLDSQGIPGEGSTFSFSLPLQQPSVPSTTDQ